jgi:hypothetical protein
LSYIIGLGKKSVNIAIAARAEAAKYPVNLFIKCQALKYLARIQIQIITHHSMMHTAYQK